MSRSSSGAALHRASAPAILKRRWGKIEAQTLEFIELLDPEMLLEVIAYTNTRGVKWAYPLWQQMLHQANHATQHRSEVAAMLTHFGCSPGDMDFLVYMDISTSSK